VIIPALVASDYPDFEPANPRTANREPAIYVTA